MSTTATTIDPEHRRLRLVFQFPASITSVVDALRLVSLRRQPAPPRVGGHVLDAGGAGRGWPTRCHCSSASMRPLGRHPVRARKS